MYGATLIIAALAYILQFVEINTPELILCRREKGMKKGFGFHLDLLMISLMSLISSVLGLPWMCAAPIQSLLHGISLTVRKPAHAPGEIAKIDHVVEERVTTMVICGAMGLTAFCGFALKYIPTPVLFGVYIYMGIANLMALQFPNQIVLYFVPAKYFPAFCRKVSARALYGYTAMQILSFGAVYATKSVPNASIAFPFVLAMIAVMRNLLMPKMFSQHTLDELDGDTAEH
jgi:hypothetical protein